MNPHQKNYIKNTSGVGNLPRRPHISSTISNQNFPYRDEYEDVEYSDEELELVNKIKNKTASQNVANDSLTAKDRLADNSTADISEIAKGLSPFPNMYNKRDGHLGKSAENVSNIHSNGFYMGSKISGHTYSKEIRNNDDESEEPIYSLEDLALKQLKEYVRIVITEVL